MTPFFSILKTKKERHSQSTHSPSVAPNPHLCILHGPALLFFFFFSSSSPLLHPTLFHFPLPPSSAGRPASGVALSPSPRIQQRGSIAIGPGAHCWASSTSLSTHRESSCYASPSTIVRVPIATPSITEAGGTSRSTPRDGITTEIRVVALARTLARWLAGIGVPGTIVRKNLDETAGHGFAGRVIGEGAAVVTFVKRQECIGEELKTKLLARIQPH